MGRQEPSAVGADLAVCCGEASYGRHAAGSESRPDRCVADVPTRCGIDSWTVDRQIGALIVIGYGKRTDAKVGFPRPMRLGQLPVGADLGRLQSRPGLELPGDDVVDTAELGRRNGIREKGFNQGQFATLAAKICIETFHAA